MSSVRRAWWWAAGACAIYVVLVLAFPDLRVATESARIRTAIETGLALVGLLVGLLAYGHHTRTGRHAHLVVAFAVVLGGTANLLVELAAAPTTGSEDAAFRTWTALVLHLVTAAALAWAALRPALTVRVVRGRAALWLWSAVVATIGPVAAVCWLARRSLPGVGKGMIVGGTLDIDVDATWPLALAVTALLIVTSVGFRRESLTTGGPLAGAFAVGALFAASSWALYTALPTAYTDIVHVGDLLRVACYLVLAVGAEQEIRSYSARLAQATASEERRRMARDLHDGLAQELAFLVRHTRLLARGQAPPGTEEMLISASDRALDEARRAIATLTARADEPLATAILAAAEDVAGRVRTRVRVTVDPTVELEPRQREAVVRIVREAVGNAGRHGGASEVRVELDGHGVLRITDDGRGFDPSAPTPVGRFGLTSMRERAEGVGATLTLTSAPGSGATVEVRLA